MHRTRYTRHCAILTGRSSPRKRHNQRRRNDFESGWASPEKVDDQW